MLKSVSACRLVVCDVSPFFSSTEIKTKPQKCYLSRVKKLLLLLTGIIFFVANINAANTDFLDVREVKTAKGGTSVLGKYPDYINLASKLGAKRFNIPTSIWNKMTPAQQWGANQKFLDRMIMRGDKIILSNPVLDVNKVSGAFRQELDYLIGKGYRLNSTGTHLIK